MKIDFTKCDNDMLRRLFAEQEYSKADVLIFILGHKKYREVFYPYLYNVSADLMKQCHEEIERREASPKVQKEIDKIMKRKEIVK